MPRRLAVAASLALAAVAAACSNPWRGYAPTYEEIVAAGWIGPEVAHVPAPLYCYATLAEPDCFPSPQPGEAGRLVGHYGTPPR
jgi:hypothetical protein